MNDLLLCDAANLPDDSLEPITSTVNTGVYYGFAQVRPECPDGEAAMLPDEDLKVWPMVMSLGWNPFYKNQKLTAVSFALFSPFRTYALL